MSFQALLFCQDEKTARTVTQVLSELDFQVEACSETFAAVKKLTSQAFEAIVVDCQNEENAGLLLKTARNSASNQASLMVAVVEGQAGVAAAFRIGANLVLTKPIAIEQARGTLRVARGLLRKNAPAPATAATPAAAKPAAAAPSVEAPTVPVSAPKPLGPPVSTPSPARVLPPSVPALAKQTPSAPFPAAPSAPPRSLPSRIAPAVLQPAASTVQVPFGKLETESEQQPAPDAASAALFEAVDFSSKTDSTGDVPFANLTGAAPQPVKPVGLPVRGTSAGFGAAAAPAKESRKALQTDLELTTPFDTVVPAKVDPAKIEAVLSSAHVEPAAIGDEIVLTATSATQSSKTPLIMIAVLLIGGAIAYFAWSQFKGHAPVPAEAPQTTQRFPPTFDDPGTSGSQTASASTEKTAAPAAQPAPVETANRFARTAPAVAPDSVSPPKAATPVSARPAQRAPLQVKTQLQRDTSAAARQDAAAEPPSIAGLTGASGTQALGTIAMAANKALPIVSLQPQRVSQGVTDGLLIKKVQPVYPAQALQMHVEGTVVLQATIGKDGNIRNVKTVSGAPILVRAATDAVRQWKYRPYSLNGQPVEIDTQISIAFKAPR